MFHIVLIHLFLTESNNSLTYSLAHHNGHLTMSEDYLVCMTGMGWTEHMTGTCWVEASDAAQQYKTQDSSSTT